MLKKRRIILIFWGICGLLLAQDMTLFMMPDMPQSNFVNPAVQYSEDWIIGVPLLASGQANFTSSFATFNDAFRYNSTSQHYVFDFDDLLSDVNGLEYIGAEVQYTPLFVGKWVNENYFTFALTEKLLTHNTLSASALKVLWYGNANMEGPYSISGSRVNGLHLREYSFGWSRAFSEKLKWGVHSKVLFGKSNVYTTQTNGFLNTDEENYSVRVNAATHVKTSFPVDLTIDEYGDITHVAMQENAEWWPYEMNRKNLGLGFDLGFVYDINAQTVLSWSLLNLGFMRWKTDVNSFDLKGNAILGGVNNLGDNYFSSALDSLTSNFSLDISNEPYFSSLTPELYLGLSHELTLHLQAGLAIYGCLLRNRIHPAFTLSVNTYNYKKLSASLSYSIRNDDFFNLGGGIGLTLRGVHIHAMGDNLLGLLNMGDQQHLNLRLGLSIVPSDVPFYRFKKKNKNSNQNCLTR
jgi:hypothetical protein